jgi:guanylate kinase
MNELAYIDQFQKLLADYRISPEGQTTLNRTTLVLMVAPSAGGRNTIIKELLKTGDYYFIISDTTRKPRMNDGVLEQTGREYWFRTEEEMLQEIRDGKFLEAEVIHNQQVSGTSIRELEKAFDQHKIAITDVDIGGIHSIIKAKPDTIALVVLPPSFKEWQKRFSGRGEMDPMEHKRRLSTACTILEDALNHPYFRFIINDTIPQAVEQVQQIARNDNVDATMQAKARAIAKKLLVDTRKAVEKL